MSSAEAFHAPSQADYVKANAPTRPVGDFDKIADGQPGADNWANRHTSLRRGLAAAFAGLAEYGGQQNHNPGQGSKFADRWLDQDAAQRQFDANQPKNQAAATVAGAGQQMGQEELGARVGLTRAQTTLALQNLPAQEAAEKLHGMIQDAWMNKKIPPQQFDQWAREQISAAPANVGRMVAPHLDEIKKMQPTGKGYSLTMQDDLPKSVNVYGKEYDRNDPQLEQLAPGAGADYDRAMGAHTAKRGEKLQDEKTVAGFAAERGADASARALGNQQTMKAKGDEYTERTAMNGVKSTNDMLHGLYDQAKAGSSGADKMLVMKFLGEELPDGTHRINDTQLLNLKDAGTLDDKAIQALRKTFVDGTTLPANVRDQYMKAVDSIHAQKMKQHQSNIDTIHQVYGGQGAQPANGGAQIQVGATATHQDGSKWKFNGGDSADPKNWSPIAQAKP